MKKIAFFDTYSDASGGAPRSMLKLMELLKSKGSFVTLFTSMAGELSAKARSNDIDSVEIIAPSVLLTRRGHLQSNTKHIFLYLISIFYFWIKCIPYLYRLKGVTLCFNDIRCFVFYLPIAIFYRHNVIWYVRINDRIKFVSSIALRLSNKVITVSNSCKNMFSDEEIYKYGHKVTTVYTGFNIPQPSPDRAFEPFSKVKLGFVGVLSKRKNIELLIDAIALLEKSVQDQVIVEVVGIPKADEFCYLDEIKQYILDKSVVNNFKFNGFLDDVACIYDKCDVVMMTSYSEGLPRTLIEGLSHGCYVITTDVDGAREIVVDQGLGKILDRYCPSELAKEIEAFILQRKEHYSSRCKRRIFVSDRFSEEAFLNNFIKAIN